MIHYVLGIGCIAKKITKINKIVIWSNYVKIFFSGLFSEIRKYKVGTVSNRESECYGEQV